MSPLERGSEVFTPQTSVKGTTSTVLRAFTWKWLKPRPLSFLPRLIVSNSHDSGNAITEVTYSLKEAPPPTLAIQRMNCQVLRVLLCFLVATMCAKIARNVLVAPHTLSRSLLRALSLSLSLSLFLSLFHTPIPLVCALYVSHTHGWHRRFVHLCSWLAPGHKVEYAQSQIYYSFQGNTPKVVHWSHDRAQYCSLCTEKYLSKEEASTIHSGF